jgi:hypothetical protein
MNPTVKYRCQVFRGAVSRAFAVIGFALLASGTPALAEDEQPNRIRIEYVAPTTPENQAIYNLMMEHHPLEKFQEIFSPFRLPIEITLRVKECDGVSNAWYQRPVVTICYEYVAELRKNRPSETVPAEDVFAGITPSDAMFGQFFYAVAHEMGHVVFDLLDVPIFGRAEDAADGFATYMMLELGKSDARRMILGAAYSYKEYIKNPRVCVPLIAFADGHAAPMQRYYNLMCIGYGADPESFSGLVEKGYLPKGRAEGCKTEYNEVNFAFHTAIAPHLDQQLAKRVLDKTWLPRLPVTPPPAVSLRASPEELDADVKVCSR